MSGQSEPDDFVLALQNTFAMTVSLIDCPFIPHMNPLYVLLCMQNFTLGLKGLVGGGGEMKGKL